MIQKIPHQIYYVLELLILTGGFYGIFILSGDFHRQVAALLVLLCFYAVWGILHHKMHHTLKKKIVIEYILISLIVMAFFLLINTNKF